MVWEPKSCCGCMSHKVGTLVIGWIHLVCAVIHVLATLMFAPFRYRPREEICKDLITKYFWDISADYCVKSIISYIILAVLSSTVYITICILLLIGVNKKKSVLMLPFMIYQVIIILPILSISGMFIIGIFLHAKHPEEAAPSIIISGLVVFQEVYFILVVRVCYQKVKQHTMNVGIEMEQVSFPNKN